MQIVVCQWIQQHPITLQPQPIQLVVAVKIDVTEMVVVATTDVAVVVVKVEYGPIVGEYYLVVAGEYCLIVDFEYSPIVGFVAAVTCFPLSIRYYGLQ
jgi:hypothetical protein